MKKTYCLISYLKSKFSLMEFLINFCIIFAGLLMSTSGSDLQRSPRGVGQKQGIPRFDQIASAQAAASAWCHSQCYLNQLCLCQCCIECVQYGM